MTFALTMVLVPRSEGQVFKIDAQTFEGWGGGVFQGRTNRNPNDNPKINRAETVIQESTRHKN